MYVSKGPTAPLISFHGAFSSSWKQPERRKGYPPFLRDLVEAFNLKGAAKSLHTPSRRMKMNKNEVIEYLVTKIEDEKEPLFLLRARDTLASRAILAWCEHAKSFSVPQEKIESAKHVAVEMDMYLGPKRFPD